MNTYRIDAVEYVTDLEGWLVVGCHEDEVEGFVKEFVNENGIDGKPMFKQITVTIEE